MSLKNNIIGFAESALVVLIRDILELDILIPTLIYDYNQNPNIKNGFYMYQNPAGDRITLNMHSILALKHENDMKTVITYGIIHEIIHMHQEITSRYKTNKNYYTLIEDSADKYTIDIIRDNLVIINSRLNFQFNEVFLKGIERQLMIPELNAIVTMNTTFNTHIYYCKTISGVLVNKLNINYDYIFNLLKDTYMLTVVFPNGRQYNLDLYNDILERLDSLINLIYLSNFKMIHSTVEDFTIVGHITTRLILRLF